MTDFILNFLDAHSRSLFASFAILILGYLAAAFVSGIAVRTFHGFFWHGLTPENQLRKSKMLRALVFSLLMAITLLLFFDRLGFSLPSDPESTFWEKLSYLFKKVSGPICILFLGWIAAYLLKAFSKITISFLMKRLYALRWITEDDLSQFPTHFSEVVYWMVLLTCLVGILDTLELRPLLNPVQDFGQKAFALFPNILASAFVLLLGIALAKVVQKLVVEISSLVGRNFNTNPSLEHRLTVSLGYFAYGLILIPAMIASLNALSLEVVTEPAISLLNKILLIIPVLLSVGLVLGSAFIIASLLQRLVQSLVLASGLENFLVAKMQLVQSSLPPVPSLSYLFGLVVKLAILGVAIRESFVLLGYGPWAEAMDFLGRSLLQLALALLWLFLGVWLIQFLTQWLRSSNSKKIRFIRLSIQISIFSFTLYIVLETLGISSQVLLVLFAGVGVSILLGAALAIGLGGKAPVEEVFREWRERFR